MSVARAHLRDVSAPGAAKPAADTGDTKNPTHTLLPDGIKVRVAWVHCDRGPSPWSRKGNPREKWWITFKVTEFGEHQGKLLLCSYWVYKTRRLSRLHHIFRDYTALTGKIPPRGVQPKDFLRNCELVAVVRTVKTNAKGEPTPPGIHYSIIDRFLEYSAGGPKR